MTEAKGEINGYTCQSGHTVYTINRDEGTTPFQIVCPTTGCSRPAYSLYYNVPRIAIATYEWYRPTEKQARRKGRAMADHVRMGGLDLRPIRQPAPRRARHERS